MRSALVIGAAGQDGRLLARLLCKRGYSVRGWTRTEAPAATPCHCEQINLLQADSIGREIKKLRPDEIYYLAAFHHATEDAVEISGAELLRRSLDIHLIGLENVLRAMKAHSPSSRLFYAASSHVFGSPASELQDEQTPLAPNSAYGISKAAGLRCCQLYREQEGLFAATGILFNHESSLRKPSFLSQKIVRGARQAQRDRTSKLILGDLGARVDWGYAPDFVEAMSRILRLPKAGDFVIASGKLHSVQQFAEIAFDAVGLDWRHHVQTDATLLKKGSQTLCGDARKLRAATGWSPTLTFEQMVRALVSEVDATEKRTTRIPAASLMIAATSRSRREGIGVEAICQ